MSNTFFKPFVETTLHFIEFIATNRALILHFVNILTVFNELSLIIIFLSIESSSMKKITLFVLLCCFVFSGFSQENLWQLAEASKIEQSSQFLRRSNPTKFSLYTLNLNSLSNTLSKTHLSKAKDVLLKFPLADGNFETFRVTENSNFQDGLQASNPNIRAYKGVSLKNKSTVINFSVSPTMGLNAMITSGKFGSFFIDTYTKDKATYMAYERQNLPAPDEAFQCEVIGNSALNQLPNSSSSKNANDGVLRNYRLALACTGEYAQFHLDAAGIPITDITTPDSEKKAVVLEAMNVSMTRVNGIYERDISIHMDIVDNNEDIIFLNFATDPYVNEDGVSMLATNQATCDGIIGEENYDIGHVYSTGGGGVAFLGVPCSLQKAGGVTGLPEPTGDPYWVDYVSHEMGHQFGANHTQNNNCQRNGSTSMEPGSASTILGYAGICAPNVQTNSDAHFHAISIDEIWNYVNTQDCEVQTPTGNTAPQAIAPADFTIPASTPFQLDAIGIDSDNDELTYCWEQIDEEIGEVMPPDPTNTLGPMFRSLPPTTERTRFMPDMLTVMQGLSANIWEVVPSVNRTMEFRVTVRDNALNGASSASDDVIVTVDSSSGPFIITSQNTETTWEPGSSQTITWDVANTDQAPINTTNVNILFSEDDGLTFPTTLASNVPNDGSQDITAPNLLTTTARVKIVPVGNSYFDVNDAPITIDGVLATTDINENLGTTIYPNPSTGNFTVQFNPLAKQDISIALIDIRGRLITTKHFSHQESFNRTLNFSQASKGVYFIKITNGDYQITEKIVIK